MVALAPPLARPAEAAIWYVNPGESIQASINAALDGDTILLADGEYTGPDNRNLHWDGQCAVARG